ncbi:hypothetical protein HMPREF0379_0240 [[Eubacterium] yurii subsp. margaretiae ATCC 43715]|nr:hypothetical protein HMPREF0379_0240 [[Eubacterium] yurii subsp. margaretiae ATCC 43715]
MVDFFPYIFWFKFSTHDSPHIILKYFAIYFITYKNKLKVISNKFVKIWYNFINEIFTLFILNFN